MILLLITYKDEVFDGEKETENILKYNYGSSFRWTISANIHDERIKD